MLFSVIVPVCMIEAYIRQCVDSILAQTCEDFELVLVDDGSPDNCGAVCDEYACADGRVRVIHKPNGGLVSARNTGLRAVRGEYVCYVDGDDWVAPNWLETIREKIEASPCRPDLIVFGARWVYPDHTASAASRVPEGFYNKERLCAEIYPYLISDRSIGLGLGIIGVTAWSRAYKRELVAAHYCRDERISLGEDDAFTFECALCAEHAYICGDLLYFYNRTNTESLMTAYHPDRLRSYALLFRYLHERLGGKDPMIDAQLNDLYANMLIMGVFHEVECGRPLRASAKHVARELRETGIAKNVSLKGLPFAGRSYILLLKLRLFWPALVGTRLWIRLKSKRSTDL